MITSWLKRTARLGARIHRHEDAEDGSPRLRLAFDDAAMIADDFGNQREPKPGARGLRRHERIKQMRQQLLGHARPVVPHAELERQRYTRLRARNGQAHPWAKRSRKSDLAPGIVAKRLSGVLHQIQKYLNKLIAVRQHRRQ